jgi:hypothetical protein
VTESAECDVEVRREVVLGKLDDAYSIVSPMFADVAPLGGDRWIVLTGDGGDVVSYDRSGNLLGLVGPRGQGPGEFAHPHTMTVGRDGSVWVSEPMTRTTMIHPDGTRETRMHGLPWAPAGFTKSGHPYSVLLGSTPAGEKAPYVQVWDEQSALAFHVGPGRHGRSNPNAAGGWVVLPLSDSTFASPSKDEYWMRIWDSAGEPGFTRGEEVIVAMGGLGDYLEGSGSAVLPDTDGGLWLVGLLRKVDREGVQELHNETARRLNRSVNSLEVQFSAAVGNAVFDGFVASIGEDGRVRGVAVIDRKPVKPVGPDRFFTLEEDTTGLISAVVWHAARRCSR